MSLMKVPLLRVVGGHRVRKRGPESPFWRGRNDRQRLKAENDVRTTLVQALAGLAVAGGLIVTYRRLDAHGHSGEVRATASGPPADRRAVSPAPADPVPHKKLKPQFHR
jgi:hypothetical protein